jgi:hypothetical protein
LFLRACPGGNQVKDNDADNSPVPAVLDNAFTLAHDQSAALESEDLAVKFVDVAEDSRCPVGVECIWQGQVKIDLEIKRQDGSPDTIQLTSLAGEPELAEKAVGDLYIRLAKVEPQPMKGSVLTIFDYRITLTISRNTASPQE